MIAPRITVASLFALTVLQVLWSVWLAPLPEARWLWIKAVPLALLVPGVMRGERRPRQWVALVTPLYFAEAITRALSEGGRHALVASAAALLCVVLFAAVLAWLRRR
jgi:uncharacterized membrane protein